MLIEAVVVVVLLRGSEPRPQNPIGIPSPPVVAPVYLAPIGPVPAEESLGLVDHYQQKLGLRMTVLPKLPIPPAAYDVDRDQVIAERLLDAIAATDAARRDPNATVIGLTIIDMYIAAEDWSYAYSLRPRPGWVTASSPTRRGGCSASRR